MVPNDAGGVEVLELSDDETIRLLEARNIPWKRDGDGHPIAIESLEIRNRSERRQTRYGGSWKQNS